MKQNIQNPILFIMWLMVLSPLLIGCSKTETGEEHQKKEQKYLFQMTSMSEIPAVILNAYFFDGNMLVKICKDITLVDAYCELATSGSSVYFLGNVSNASALQAISVGKTTLEQFCQLRNDIVAGDTEPQIFYSGAVKLTEQSPDTIRIDLYRSVAQLSLDTSRDAAITVTRITVSEASANTTLTFAADKFSPASEPRVEYDKIYEPAITSTQAVQYLYESDKPVRIKVYALYNDIPKIVDLEIPKVQRNKIYNIKLEGLGGNITASFNVVPWGDGGTVGSVPDENGKILLSKSNSTLVEGADVDEKQGIISVPETGGKFTIAFVSDIAVELAAMEGGGYTVSVPFKPNKVEVKDGKVVSYFNVEVLPQDKGKLPYTAKITIKRANLQFGYDHFSIAVKGSKFQLFEVKLGGVTWMAFNATSKNIDDQIYPVDGYDVESMYRKNWGATIGGLFQWGRLYKYTPWLSGVNNQGGGTTNNPWVADTHMPCPTGYRVPTKAELRALLPPETVLPGRYTYNGESVTATLNTSEPETIQLGTVTGKGRYLSIKSDTSGATLFIPLAGQKGDKSGSNNPEFGAGFTLWASTTANVGGWATTSKYWPGINGTTYKIGADDMLQAEGYAYVRCIKK